MDWIIIFFYFICGLIGQTSFYETVFVRRVKSNTPKFDDLLEKNFILFGLKAYFMVYLLNEKEVSKELCTYIHTTVGVHKNNLLSRHING